MSRRSIGRRTSLVRPPSTPPRPSPRRRVTTEDNQSETVLKDPIVGTLLTDIEAAGGIEASWKFQDLCNTNPAVYGFPGSDTRRYFQRINYRLQRLSRVQYLELINYFGILAATHTHPSQSVLYARTPPASVTNTSDSDDDFDINPPRQTATRSALVAFQDYPSPSRPQFSSPLQESASRIQDSASRRLVMNGQAYAPLPGHEQYVGKFCME
jgi:hypothetical protein